ncbi:FkbM family methyltransferase [Flavihumibacter profundi]|uniref:FkbM family methyltransferase n=1 Tax=Flavihumibacter profundi TaxID=2716883 RepID=UPI001CC558EC|nr:FkbM family methyltransferase [Flavihumibacter profundi]MBZ5858000.1 FkbM family methyltransferase [Flavihumibacter profundi]
MIQKFRETVRQIPIVRKIFGYYIASSGIADRLFKNYVVNEVWQKRIDDVLVCKDNAFIERVANAGTIRKGKQIMHNGLLIHLGSYYGPEVSRMISLNKGVHEPQEERVFQEVIKLIPAGGVMIELGAFWSFYSMWFNLKVPGAKNIMVEPDKFNLGQGKRNFSLNRMRGTFINAFVGSKASIENGTRIISVDSIVNEFKLDFVHVLHSDIQGFELDMLQGARQLFTQQRVGYIFISTHSNEVHYKCKEFLESNSCTILCSADCGQAFSEDGLLVARGNWYPGLEPISIDLKQPA